MIDEANKELDITLTYWKIPRPSGRWREHLGNLAHCPLLPLQHLPHMLFPGLDRKGLADFAAASTLAVCRALGNDDHGTVMVISPAIIRLSSSTSIISPKVTAV